MAADAAVAMIEASEKLGPITRDLHPYLEPGIHAAQAENGGGLVPSMGVL